MSNQISNFHKSSKDEIMHSVENRVFYSHLKKIRENVKVV